MLASKNPYNTEIPTMSEWQKISEAEITKQLQKYLETYKYWDMSWMVAYGIILQKRKGMIA